MDTVTSVVATGVVVSVGQWSQDKSLSVNEFVGMGFVAGFLAVMQSSNQAFAEKFGVLILVAAVLMYGIPISKKLSALGGKK